MRGIARYCIPTGLLLLTLCPTAASADDFVGSGFSDLPSLTGRWAVGVLMAIVAFFLIVAVEGGVLHAFLGFDYGRSFGYAMVANFASTWFGWVCRLFGWEAGWKTALAGGHLEHLAVLLVRSFLITVAVEGIVLLALLPKRAERQQILKATLAANAASYGVIALWLLLPHALR